MPTENEVHVLTLAQNLMTGEEGLTAGTIAGRVDLVLTLKPGWAVGLNRQWVVDELIRRRAIWTGKDLVLSSDKDHIDWLEAGRKKDWRYWMRYRQWLERRQSLASVDAVDRATDELLKLLEDPLRPGPWDRRGLVVGHVQSGKTSNYTGLICKAADAGYKIIIVLAGLHNNLRSQTQMRLDEGFLGYETAPSATDIRAIGVGEIDRDPSIRPNYATNRTEKGDFNTALANRLGITPEQRPWLFVVKKNKSVLELLYKWIDGHVADAREGERPLVTNLPLLMIDDEADNASVDTGEQLFDVDGAPDDEHRPTAINSCIRKILHAFHRSAYVGYTATPFANIFIHERGETRAVGPDLFPAAFIYSLGAPSNYVGPAKVFGATDGTARTPGLPVVHELDEEHEHWMPRKHKKDHAPLYQDQPQLPPSLAEAVDAFILVCAARRLRGQQFEHCSMLIHVTRFNDVQRQVVAQVQDHVDRIRQRITRKIDHLPVLARLQALWEREFVKKGATIRAAVPDASGPDHPWDEVLAALPDALADLQVRMINGTAKDALDYADTKTTGLKVIAVGGDKLSRGLTLEGLSVSYFLRASKMYDTLMQMGRWFGYRPGYLDLCRLYTTSELVEWFGHITDAADELREEFEMMAASNATPREYGLKVQSHSVLMVTSRLKMRTARDLQISFSGQVLETVSLVRRPQDLVANCNATARLVSGLGDGTKDPVRARPGGRRETWNGWLWDGVPSQKVADFLRSYKTHPDAMKVNGALMAEFVERMAGEGELTSWAVALLGPGEAGAQPFKLGSLTVPMTRRKAKSVSEGRYSIGRLLSPRDEAIDLDEQAWAVALQATHEAWVQGTNPRQTNEPEAPNGPSIRKVRGFGANGVPAHPERGLLLLYLLDPSHLHDPSDPAPAPEVPVVAFGVSFPGSNSGTKVVYKVNNVLWEQEYGASE